MSHAHNFGSTCGCCSTNYALGERRSCGLPPSPQISQDSSELNAHHGIVGPMRMQIRNPKARSFLAAMPKKAGCSLHQAFPSIGQSGGGADGRAACVLEHGTCATSCWPCMHPAHPALKQGKFACTLPLQPGPCCICGLKSHSRGTAWFDALQSTRESPRLLLLHLHTLLHCTPRSPHTQRQVGSTSCRACWPSTQTSASPCRRRCATPTLQVGRVGGVRCGVLGFVQQQVWAMMMGAALRH